MKKAERQLTCSISQPPIDGPTALSAIKGRADDGETSRNQKRGTDPLQAPSDYQETRARRHATPDRRSRKRRHAQQKDALPSELVGQRSADQNERPKEESV